MKFALRFFSLLFMALLSVIQIEAATAYTSTVQSTTGDITAISALPVKIKKPGLFQRIHATKAMKKYMKEQGKAREEVSKMAIAALVLFISFFILILLTSLATFFLNLAILALLTSTILSFIILMNEDNLRSRRIAKLILVINGVLMWLGVAYAIYAIFLIWQLFILFG